jgi:hypothetical protein
MVNGAGKMDKACLILSMGMDIEDTVRDAFQAIGNNTKGLRLPLEGALSREMSTLWERLRRQGLLLTRLPGYRPQAVN